MTSDHHPAIRPSIGNVSIEQLAREFSSPLFVFCEKTLRDRFRQYHSAFTTRYENTLFAWSYKTNYLKAICSLYHQEGAAAEIVSAMEWEKACSLNVPEERIIFNGPHKPRAILKEALRAGARINVDHLDELRDIEEIATELGRVLDVGLRLNLDVGEKATWARFGLNLESGEAFDAVRQMTSHGKIRLRGLHSHIGTFVLDAGRYARQVEKMVGFAYEVEDQLGQRIDYIDIGGGFASLCKRRHDKPENRRPVPTADDYAMAITSSLKKHLRPGHTPELIVESGRALIDNAGFLITSVVATKQLPTGKPFYVINAGVNLLSMLALIEIGVETAEEHDAPIHTSMLCGPLCMNTDIVRHEVDLPALKRGDHLILSPVGAYNITQSMPFIEYRPAVVLVRENGKTELIREREDLSDIDRREIPLGE